MMERRKFLIGTVVAFFTACSKSEQIPKLKGLNDLNNTKNDDNLTDINKSINLAKEDLNITTSEDKEMDENITIHSPKDQGKEPELTEEQTRESNDLFNISTGNYKSLKMHNVHTGDNIDVVFKIGDRYIESEVDKINWIFRDWRAKKIKTIDMDLIEVLSDVQKEMRGVTFNLNSGYRTIKTNRKVGGVKTSQHIKGTASDISFSKLSNLNKFYKIVKKKKGLGVGYYSRSKFVHVDSRGYSARWIK